MSDEAPGAGAARGTGPEEALAAGPGEAPGNEPDAGVEPALESAPDPAPDESPDTVREARPMIERIGLAAIAFVLALLFGGVSAASWVGGEPFLAVMAGIGCLMTLWVGTLTLVRG